jgi:H+/Cl- antiporter ClcA
MLPLSIFGVTVGTILGTRFRVLVLVPVIFCAAAAIIAIGFINGFGVGTSLVALLVILASIEFGYLAGCFGAGYLLRRIKFRRITGLPADGIALAALATAIVLFAVFYELNGGHHTERTAAAPHFSLPADSGNPSDGAPPPNESSVKG